MAKSTAVEEKKDNLPVDPSMFEEDQGIGSSDMGQEDLALPFLKALSRQDELLDTLEDAKAGDIYNTVSGEIFPGGDGINVIPCAYQRRFIQWAPRGEGSGAPIAIFTPDEQRPRTERDPTDNKDYVVDESGAQIDGTYIEETHQHFVIIMKEDGSMETALIAMKATQLKKSRKWNSMVSSRSMVGKNGPFTPPRFSHLYHLKTVAEKNDKGSWHGWDISLVGPIEDAFAYKQAKEFANSIQRGDVVVKHSQEDGEEVAEAKGNTIDIDDDIPF